MNIIERKPGIAYIDTHFWVPLDLGDREISRLRRRYTFLLPQYEKGLPEVMRLWRETGSHLILPRTATEIIGDLGATDLRPEFPRTQVISEINLRGYIQRKSMEKWMASNGGVLNLACGLGKTVVSLEAIARYQVPALVVVHTSVLYRQWQREIKKFLRQVSVGTIQGPPSGWTWDRDVVVAMLPTLHQHLYAAMDPKIRLRYGIIIFDEAHRLPAEEYHALADVFPGARFGLTATPARNDGRQLITRAHLGPIFYSNLKQQISPTIYFQIVNFPLNLRDPEVAPHVRDKRGQVHLGKLRKYAGQWEDRNRWWAHYILWLQQLGRRLIVLSHSVDQVYLLRDMLTDLGAEGVGVCAGPEGTEQRLEIVGGSKLLLGTTQIAGEGLDKKELDTLVLLSPVGKDVSGSNAIQQSIGRILRPVKGKNPVVIFAHDIGISRFNKMSLAMARVLDAWPESKGGPLTYTRVAPEDRPPILGTP